ncbi:class III extradiol ring-cleavage dioxygenase [Dyella sp. BiH032]|uniref:DODA-type extradiol aromatic ring-opening family dioxygenase n=1 Tax=Dyella sp. BiH032 TaxID=3075430 RepID=UPI00289319B0|nr:class III extradiol ring-cleavage dioxygenase [Dyella sp. BiH032]WNL46478.1 class III extradiol ring-cleavage dioxygenase [Dyella sp. BiH032]
MALASMPTYFLSHGGGPWPWLKHLRPGMYDQLEASLHQVRHELGAAPRAVLMISGHWEARRFLVSSSARPPMVYDYGGFPEHTYRIRYDAPGDPALAGRVRDLLERGGLAADLDPQRGFDHGTFSLMQTMYPEATLPVVQLALRSDFDPAAHLQAGELLAPLRNEGIVIVGSGFSFHDTAAMRSGRGGSASATFDRWLGDTLVDAAPDERRRRLIEWTRAPSARAAHPREDHLLPLMVALGAAGHDAGTRIYHQTDFMGAITASSFRFGLPVAQPNSEIAAA